MTFEDWRNRVLVRRERRLDMREDNITREVTVNMIVSIPASWLDTDITADAIRIFDESLYEDSEMWVKEVKVIGGHDG
jgi:hypothetical protein